MDEHYRWYLVQCKPRDSFRAELHLKNQQYECFHPTYLIKQKRAGEVRTVVAPLFPHYLFISLSPMDNWSKIRSTRGVSHLVQFNGAPASLASELVDGLKQHCAKLHGVLPESMFQTGDRVVVTDGCFKQLEAVVTATTGDERVTLLLKLLNRDHYLE